MNRPRHTLFWLMLAVVAIKVSLFFWGSHMFNPPPGTAYNWLSIWDHWDADAYKVIASQGYFPEGIPELQKAFVRRFPPLFPGLLYLVSHGLGLSLVISGIAISLLATFGSSYLLYRLAELEGFTDRQAVATVLLFSVFPTSFYSNSIYSEGVYLLSVIGTFVALRKERFFVAGLAASAAILTRVVGLSLLPAIAIGLVWRWRQGRLTRMDLTAIVIPAWAFVGYMAMNAYLFGSATSFYREYQASPSPMLPQWPLQEPLWLAWELFNRFLDGKADQAYMMYYGWNPIFTFGCLGTLIWWMWKKPRLDLVAYALCYVLMFSSFRQNFSYPRYTYAVVPLFLALGQIRPVWVQVLLGLGFGALLLYFVNIFVNGGWAF
ncbi:MAG: hypothetical protein H7338_00455 [Candidatus Sericytochromatia bacterium]|nr:hypothetical protein [Candidatus Sericytochromatia bacterium]